MLQIFFSSVIYILQQIFIPISIVLHNIVLLDAVGDWSTPPTSNVYVVIVIVKTPCTVPP